MPWWIPLAAAGIPAAIDAGKSLFGAGARRDRRVERMNDANRKTLNQMLMNEATGDPMENMAIQSALGELGRMMEVQQQQDQQTAARYGLAGSEYEIAQGARRGNTFTDAFLGIAGQAGRQRSASLSQALEGQRMTDSYQISKKDQRNRSAANLGSALGNAGYASAQLYGDK